MNIFSMMPNLYHFAAKRPLEDLKLSPDHKLSGHVAQYLKNFQLDGVRFLYKHFESNQSCILNDESGLGKTATVAAFLEAVLPLNASRKCLIIVKDDDRLVNWLFHINVLTKLSSKVAHKEEDIGSEIVYLAKWDTIQRYSSISAHNFDCVFVDNRGELLANKICSGYLLRNYENKISLIISSADVAVDLKQFHVMLRLCGRLDKKYENLATFEEKFSLPSTLGTSEDVNILEAYFLRREKIINFCRDFRLRRYRHQYEDELPLVGSDEYRRSLGMWRESPLSRSYSTSSSIKILTSSSEKDTEDLLNSYFEVKQEEALNSEVARITANKGKSTEVQEVVEAVDMSPLLFESDSEDRGPDRKEAITDTHVSSEFIIPIVLEDENNEVKEKRLSRIQDNKKQTEKSESVFKKKIKVPGPILRKMTRTKIATKTPVSVNGKKLGNFVKKEKNNNSNLQHMKSSRATRSRSQKDNLISLRSMRSDHATRSKSLKSKYLVIDLTLDDTQKKKRKVRNQKVERRKHTNEKNIKNKKKSSDKDIINTRSKRKMEFEMMDDPEQINKKAKRMNGKQGFRKKGNENIQNSTKNNVSKSVRNHISEKSRPFHESRKKVVEVDSPTPGNSNSSDQYLSTKYNFNVDINKKIQSEIHQNSSEVNFVSPQNQVIVLSGSTEGDSQRSSNASSKRLSGLSSAHPSPDLFSNAEEYDLFCSQKNKFGTNIKHISPGNKLRDSRKSCLDLLEKEFHGRRVYESEEIFEVTTNGNMAHSPEDADVSGTRNRSISVFQKNKITKYLIGTETPSLESNFSSDIFEIRRNGDHCLKTPKRQKVVQKPLSLKKSPKAIASRNLTPNSLTKWLIKNGNCSDGPSKTSKRRRLDLSFGKTK